MECVKLHNFLIELINPKGFGISNKVIEKYLRVQLYPIYLLCNLNLQTQLRLEKLNEAQSLYLQQILKIGF